MTVREGVVRALGVGADFGGVGGFRRRGLRLRRGLGWGFWRRIRGTGRSRGFGRTIAVGRRLGLGEWG
jgi:hypothetical protein